MTTQYLAVWPQQEPFDLSLDDAGRALWAFNVIAWKRPSATFLQELIGILEAAGVGVENVSIFASSRAVIPDGSEPDAPPAILLIKATAGLAPVGTHNEAPAAWDRRPAAEIFVHAGSTQAAVAMIHAAYNALANVRNQAVAS